ncbi:MAG: hypothetical protein Q9190_005876 [Brigantiaea leucoxantha]
MAAILPGISVVSTAPSRSQHEIASPKSNSEAPKPPQSATESLAIKRTTSALIEKTSVSKSLTSELVSGENVGGSQPIHIDDDGKVAKRRKTARETDAANNTFQSGTKMRKRRRPITKMEMRPKLQPLEEREDARANGAAVKVACLKIKREDDNNSAVCVTKEWYLQETEAAKNRLDRGSIELGKAEFQDSLGKRRRKPVNESHADYQLNRLSKVKQQAREIKEVQSGALGTVAKKTKGSSKGKAGRSREKEQDVEAESVDYESKTDRVDPLGDGIGQTFRKRELSDAAPGRRRQRVKLAGEASSAKTDLDEARSAPNAVVESTTEHQESLDMQTLPIPQKAKRKRRKPIDQQSRRKASINVVQSMKAKDVSPAKKSKSQSLPERYADKQVSRFDEISLVDREVPDPVPVALKKGGRPRKLVSSSEETRDSTVLAPTKIRTLNLKTNVRTDMFTDHFAQPESILSGDTVPPTDCARMAILPVSKPGQAGKGGRPLKRNLTSHDKASSIDQHLRLKSSAQAKRSTSESLLLE